MLTASPADGTVFGSWGGNCAGSSLSCSLLLEGAASVSATFALGGPGPMKLEAVTVPSNAGIALVTVSGVAITSAVAAPGYQVRVVGTIGGSTQLLIRPVAVDGAIVPGRLVDLQVADRGALSTVVVNQVAARRSAGYAPLEALTLSARVAKP
ncbi:MAG: hypothetical protein HOP28_18370 [Gemmatimonadales bacterium]|nr:hypothetical protein [Gemmatimonadales bacterium]